MVMVHHNDPSTIFRSYEAGAKDPEGKYFIAFLGHRYPGFRCQPPAKKTAGLVEKETDEISTRLGMSVFRPAGEL
jgi:hypothetical protein